MLNFVKAVFRGFFEVILWANLILCAIGGGVFANMTYSTGRYGSSGIHPFFGVLIGLVVGILTNIVGGGLIATLLNIDQNIENLCLSGSLSKGNFTSGSQGTKKCQNCGKMIDNGYTACPHCGAGFFSSSAKNLSDVSSVRRIEETKRCSKCGRSVDSTLTSCPHCKGSEFA